jgi:hypothetical protein
MAVDATRTHQGILYCDSCMILGHELFPVRELFPRVPVVPVRLLIQVMNYFEFLVIRVILGGGNISL